MNLDDELRRVLSDDRLNVAVQPGAEQHIVAGAQRLRRRRMATVSTVGGLAVAVLVGGGIVLANANRDDALPPAERTTTSETTTTTTTTTTTPPTPPSTVGPSGKPNGPPTGDSETTVSTRTAPPRPTGLQIGPDGFGVLRLGMSFDEAVAANGTEGQPPDPAVGCSQYPLLYEGEPAGYAFFSANRLEMLSPTPDLHTVDGVSTGWTVEQVRAVYPDITDEAIEGGWVMVNVTGNPNAMYHLTFTDGVLTSIRIELTDQNCAG